MYAFIPKFFESIQYISERYNPIILPFPDKHFQAIKFLKHKELSSIDCIEWKMINIIFALIMYPALLLRRHLYINSSKEKYIWSLHCRYDAAGLLTWVKTQEDFPEERVLWRLNLLNMLSYRGNQIDNCGIEQLTHYLTWKEEGL